MDLTGFWLRLGHIGRARRTPKLKPKPQWVESRKNLTQTDQREIYLEIQTRNPCDICFFTHQYLLFLSLPTLLSLPFQCHGSLYLHQTRTPNSMSYAMDSHGFLQEAHCLQLLWPSCILCCTGASQNLSLLTSGFWHSSPCFLGMETVQPFSPTVLKIEASHILGKCSYAWATFPIHFFIFCWDNVPLSCTRWLWNHSVAQLTLILQSFCPSSQHAMVIGLYH